ncbi:MAG: hypothetical protein DRI56_10315, partial [Chloroflexota bacterium]
PGDTVLIHFGGSGSEVEICRQFKRNFITAEIDEKYYKMIIDRLNSGKIRDKYRLEFRQRENVGMQPLLLEKQEEYDT